MTFVSRERSEDNGKTALTFGLRRIQTGQVEGGFSGAIQSNADDRNAGTGWEQTPGK